MDNLTEWNSQIINEPFGDCLISISDGNDLIYINVPPYYSVSKNTSFYLNARDAILHRFLYGEYVVITPSSNIMEELDHIRREENCSCIGCIVHASNEGTKGGSSPMYLFLSLHRQTRIHWIQVYHCLPLKLCQ